MADGSAAGNTAGGLSRSEFQRGDPQAVWWAQIDKRYAADRERIRVRWLSPDGAIAQEAEAESHGRREVVAAFPLPGDDAPLGIWRIEATLDDHIIDRRTFRLVPAL